MVTRKPGGTVLGEKLRQLLLEPGQAPIGARAETLLMAADRAQHFDEVVLPTLLLGRHVVSDRTAFSSLAYQGGGRELGIEDVRAVNEFAMSGRWPDAVVLLEVPPIVARNRLGRRLDRMEQEVAGFHERVAATFDLLAETDRSSRWHRIVATGSIDDVTEAVWSAVADLFPQSRR